MNFNDRIDAAGCISLLDRQVQVDLGFIRKNAYLREGDALIVGGSLIEGIGNPNSDIDVYVLSDRLRTAGELDIDRHFRVFSPEREILTGHDAGKAAFLIHTVLPGSKIKVDIEYRTWHDIYGIANKLNDLFHYATSALILLTTPFDRRDLALVHRLHNSVIDFGREQMGDLLKIVSRPKFQYLMFRWKVADYSVLLDMQGAWMRREFIRCADLARENMVTQFHAHTHLCGNTSYNRKWILPYAQMHGVNPTLYDRYVALLMQGPGLVEGDLRRYIHATLDFVDEVFEANSRLLAQQPIFPSGRRAVELIDTYRSDAAGDYSEDELAYCKKSYGESAAPTRAWFP